MFKLKIYCNDGNNQQYWEDGNGVYETYDKALIACYGNALQETGGLNATHRNDSWFEVEEFFEVTDTYKTKIIEDVELFPVAVVCYDKAPWNRENDCDITIVTGYDIVEIKED